MSIQDSVGMMCLIEQYIKDVGDDVEIFNDRVVSTRRISKYFLYL